MRVLNAQGPVMFEAAATRIDGIEDARPTIHYETKGHTGQIVCDYVAACDGYPRRWMLKTIPAHVRKLYEEVYPFGWLGIWPRWRR